MTKRFMNEDNMEQDRYQQNHALYVTGILCLILSMGLFAFALYIMPYLLWGWLYKVPGFILSWRHWLQLEYQLTEYAASWIIFIFFLLLAIFTAVVAYKASNRIDNQIYHIEPEKKPNAPRRELEIRETANILSKIVLIVVLVILGVILFQWLIYVPPPG